MGALRRIFLGAGLALAALAALLALPGAQAQCQPTCIGGVVGIGVDNAEGVVAFAGLGNARAQGVAVSGGGNAEGGLVAIAGLGTLPDAAPAHASGHHDGRPEGNARAGLVAVSTTGNAEGLVAVSLTRNADGLVAVGGGDLGRALALLADSLESLAARPAEA